MIFDRMGYIGRNGDRSGAHDGQIGDDPLRSVLADQPDPLAAANPERSEAERQPTHIARRSGPADRLIATRMLGPQKRLVAKPSRLVKEHRRQAAAAVVVHSSPVLPLVFLRVLSSRRNSRVANHYGNVQAFALRGRRVLG